MKKYDDGFDFDTLDKEPGNMKFILPIMVVVILLAAVILTLIFIGIRGRNGEEPANADVIEEMQTETTTEGMSVVEDTESTDTTEDSDIDDPQNSNMGTGTGESVDVTELVSAGSAAETEEVTYGIDVAKYQGTIDWSQVAASGIDFAMVRVGYRTQKTGEIMADTNAKYNMQEAQANGIKVGAYFFSTAITTEEAIAEANWVADYISQYQITYPVAYNCEGFDMADSRQYSLTQAERTEIAIAFLNQIYNRGYTPMFYAAKNELTADAKWDTSKIDQTYRVWVAHYTQTSATDYTGPYAMWQYTNQGTIPGISKTVDVNIAYFGYEGTAEAQSSEAPETVTADVEALMSFSDVNETVTAKQQVNLRDIPSQGSDSTVLVTLQNGDTATRTGISNSGWSRLSYNGLTYYAVSSYLTTDLSVQAPAASTAEGSGSGDGLKTQFESVSDTVTAKIEVNLRALPSVTNPDAVVVAVLKNGEYITRTGINNDFGWSRVDYNGQTLYCISSYLTTQ